MLYYSWIGFLILYTLLLPSKSWGQKEHLYIQNYGLEDGLSHNNISNILLDAKGLLWIGTRYGLNSFDGQEFKVYTKYSHNLASNSIDYITHVDSQSIWIKYHKKTYNTENNGILIDVFNLLSKQVEPLKNAISPELHQKLMELEEYSIKSLGYSQVLISKDNFWALYNTKSKTLHTLPLSNNKLSARNIIFTSPQHYWLQYQEEGDSVFHIKCFNHNHQLEDSCIISGYILSLTPSCLGNDAIIISQDSLHAHTTKTYYYKQLHQPIIPITSSEPLNRSIFPNLNSKVYYSRNSDDELVICDSNLVVQHTIPSIPIKGNKVHWAADKTGGFWIAKYGLLTYIKLLQQKFTIHKPPSTNKKQNGYVKFLSTTQDSLLFVRMMDKVVYKININQPKLIKPWFIDNNTRASINTFSDPYHPDDIWVRAEKESLSCFDVEGNLKQRYKLGALQQRIYAFQYFPKTNKYLLGCYKGFQTLNPLEDSVKKYVSNIKGHKHLIDKASIRSFYEDNNGDVWATTSQGVICFNEHMQIKSLHTGSNNEKPNSIPFFDYSHITQDKDDSSCYWLTTFGDGLLQWYPQSGQYQHYTTQDGLSHNHIYCVYDDGYGYLWLATDKGINRFDKSTHNVQIFLPKNGISHFEFNSYAHQQMANGQLYFGSMNGITSFHPKDFISKDSSFQPLIITEWKQYNPENNTYSDKTYEVLTEKQITILSNSRNSILKFALLDYFSPKTHRYAYQIEGIDQDWQYLSIPNIYLGGIPYGRYTLKIKAMGANNLWSPPLKIPLIVPYPYYMRWWAILLYVTILSTIVGLIVHWRIQQLIVRRKELEDKVTQRTQKIKQQAEELKQLDNLKSHFFANISHELRTPLTLILGPLAYIIDQPESITPALYKELNTMQRNGKRLLQLIEEILDLSKLEAKKIELKELPVELYSLVNNVYQHFERQAIAQGLNFSLDYQLEQQTIALLDKNKIDKILFNLLSNAFKFTPLNGSVKLVVYRDREQLCFDIIDDGQGIAEKDLPYIFGRFYQPSSSEGGTGIGLALCKEFTELMEGSITVESKLSEGSYFAVRVPFKQTLKEANPIPVTTAIVDAPTSNPSTLGSHRILIVEDNKDMRYFIQRLLEHEYKVHSVENGLEALRWLDQHEVPDLIISDVMMPKMNGFELLENLKKREEYCLIPTIMLTALSAEHNKLKALTIGVDDYLIKPFSPNELIARIHNIIANQLLRQNFEQNVANNIADNSSEPLPKKTLPEKDFIWLKETEIITKKLATDIDFKTAALAKAMAVSESTLKRRLKKITGMSAGQYIKEVRLQLARSYLERGTYHTITEVSHAAGFTTPHYFSKEYEKRFGKRVQAYF